MSVFVCGISAANYYATNETILESPLACRAFPSKSGEGSGRYAQELAGFLEASLPVHVMVGKDSQRHEMKTLVHHCCSADLPAGSFLYAGKLRELQKDVYISSPEFTFVQMASVLSFQQLVHFGFELCGTYYYHKTISGDYDIYPRPPLTAPKKLATFLAKCSAHGVTTARKAVKFVLPNAASPMESVIPIFLSLSYKYEGFGIALPCMNYEIEIPGQKKDLLRKKKYRGDVCWPEAKFDVEYDSDLFHFTDYDAQSSAVHASLDSSRRQDLAVLGYDVRTVTRLQLRDTDEVTKLAIDVASHLGKRIDKRQLGYRPSREEMQHDLLRYVAERMKPQTTRNSESVVQKEPNCRPEDDFWEC